MSAEDWSTKQLMANVVKNPDGTPKTWELKPCEREPVLGEIRYLQGRFPIEGGASLFSINVQAIWNGEDWIPAP